MLLMVLLGANFRIRGESKLSEAEPGVLLKVPIGETNFVFEATMVPLGV
jgi:hypothetical protein